MLVLVILFNTINSHCWYMIIIIHIIPYSYTSTYVFVPGTYAYQLPGSYLKKSRCCCILCRAGRAGNYTCTVLLQQVHLYCCCNQTDEVEQQQYKQQQYYCSTYVHTTSINITVVHLYTAAHTFRQISLFFFAADCGADCTAEVHPTRTNTYCHRMYEYPLYQNRIIMIS